MDDIHAPTITLKNVPTWNQYSSKSPVFIQLKEWRRNRRDRGRQRMIGLDGLR